MVKMKSTKLTRKLLLQYQARWRFTAVGVFASIVLWCASNICSDWRRIQSNLTIDLKMCALVFNCRTIIARVVNMGIDRFLKAYGRFFANAHICSTASIHKRGPCLSAVLLPTPCVSNANPDSKVHRANMGPTWVLSVPVWPHVGSMSLAIREHPHLRRAHWRGERKLTRN